MIVHIETKLQDALSVAWRAIHAKAVDASHVNPCEYDTANEALHGIELAARKMKLEIVKSEPFQPMLHKPQWTKNWNWIEA